MISSLRAGRLPPRRSARGHSFASSSAAPAAAPHAAALRPGSRRGGQASAIGMGAVFNTLTKKGDEAVGLDFAADIKGTCERSSLLVCQLSRDTAPSDLSLIYLVICFWISLSRSTRRSLPSLSTSVALLLKGSCDNAC